jgi:muramidase (phage lysozyme)
MDKTVPAGAALLLDFIGKTETGKEGREGYDVIYAHAQGRLPKPITQMTIAELQGHQKSDWPAVSTASGRYQFMRATLRDLRTELNLRDSQVFDPGLQDRLGYHLLKRRGYAAFMAGTISDTEFGKRLAQEWASFPVLAATKGQHRQVARGETYYAGDKLNKALVKPETIEALLVKARTAGSGPVSAPPPDDIPHHPELPAHPIDLPDDVEAPEPKASGIKPAVVVTAIIIALALAGAFFFLPILN